MLTTIIAYHNNIFFITSPQQKNSRKTQNKVISHSFKRKSSLIPLLLYHSLFFQILYILNKMDFQSERRFLMSFCRELKAELELEREVRMELERRLRLYEPSFTTSRATRDRIAIDSAKKWQQFTPTTTTAPSDTQLQQGPIAKVGEEGLVTPVLSVSLNTSTESAASYFARPSASSSRFHAASTAAQPPATGNPSTTTSDSVGLLAHMATIRSFLFEQEIHSRWQLSLYEADCFDAICAVFVLQQEGHQGEAMTAVGGSVNPLPPPSAAQEAAVVGSTTKKKQEGAGGHFVVGPHCGQKVEVVVEEATPRRQLAFFANSTSTPFVSPIAPLSVTTATRKQRDHKHSKPMTESSPTKHQHQQAEDNENTNSFHRYQTLIDTLIQREAKALQQRDTALRDLQLERQLQTRSPPPPPTTADNETTFSARKGAGASPSLLTDTLSNNPSLPLRLNRASAPPQGRSPECQRLLEEVLALTNEAIRRSS